MKSLPAVRKIIDVYIRELNFYYNSDDYKNVLLATGSPVEILEASLEVIEDASKILASMMGQKK